jgi:N-acetylmuramoyl-L-alanine amidase
MAGQLAPVCKAGKLNAPREPGDCTEPLGALGMRVMRRLMLIVIVLLAPTAVFAAMVMADREFGGPAREYGYVVKVDLPPAGGVGGLPQIDGPMDASRPLVVIDAGHGGKDPGAGTGGIKEKAVTLALALALRDELIKQGGVRVALTRSDDTYVLLDERPAIARRLGADLFISIHADSTDGDGSAMGATVYTLSATGSSQTAERIAARENAADQINGVRIKDQSDAVNAILVDLSQRESQTASQQFAGLILREARGVMPFKDAAVQSAAFVVLKSPDVPSVLFETGYINNPGDLARLTSSAGRQGFAVALATAIKVYFARSSALRR